MNTIHRKKYMLLLPVILMGFLQVTIAQDNRIVRCEISCADTVRSGDSLQFEVRINIAESWHLYASSEGNILQELQITQVKFHPLPAGFRAGGSMKLPPAQFMGGHEVYMGDQLAFTQAFVVARDIAPGSYRLKGKLIYQACNASACFPPVEEGFERVVHVRDAK